MAHNGLTHKLPRSSVSDTPDGRPPRTDLCEFAPLHSVSFRDWLYAALDRMVLAMAVAGAHDDLAMLDPQYAEGMTLVFDDYFGRRPPRRITIDDWPGIALTG
jgi:hypothetical protein